MKSTRLELIARGRGAPYSASCSVRGRAYFCLKGLLLSRLHPHFQFARSCHYEANPIVDDATSEARLFHPDLRLHERSQAIEQARSTSINTALLEEIRVFSDIPTHHFSPR